MRGYLRFSRGVWGSGFRLFLFGVWVSGFRFKDFRF